MSKGNPAVKVRLLPDQLARLKEIATAEGISLSDLVRQALQFYLLNKK